MSAGVGSGWQQACGELLRSILKPAARLNPLLEQRICVRVENPLSAVQRIPYCTETGKSGAITLRYPGEKSWNLTGISFIPSQALTGSRRTDSGIRSPQTATALVLYDSYPTAHCILPRY